MDHEVLPEVVPAPTSLLHVTPTSYITPKQQPYGLMHRTGNVDVPLVSALTSLSHYLPSKLEEEAVRGRFNGRVRWTASIVLKP